MILRRGEDRQEIDRVPPPAATEVACASLPEPVCPQGIPTVNTDLGNEQPPAPGASALDEGLARLEEAFEDGEGGDA